MSVYISSCTLNSLCLTVLCYVCRHVNVSLSFINTVQKGGVDGELPKQKI